MAARNGVHPVPSIPRKPGSGRRATPRQQIDRRWQERSAHKTKSAPENNDTTVGQHLSGKTKRVVGEVGNDAGDLRARF